MTTTVETTTTCSCISSTEAYSNTTAPRKVITKPWPIHRAEPKIGRNAPCPCGSGVKYKRCHGKPKVEPARYTTVTY